jgi:hypothetical protein
MQKEHITQASDALLNRQNGLAQAVYRKNACRSRGPEGYIARRDRECEFTVLYAVAVLTRHTSVQENTAVAFSPNFSDIVNRRNNNEIYCNDYARRRRHVYR